MMAVAVTLALLAASCGGNDGTPTDSSDEADVAEDDTDVNTDLPDDTPSEDVTAVDTEPDPDSDAIDGVVDVPVDELDEDAPTGGIVGDPCASEEDCGGVPSTDTECLEAYGTILIFPNGYCTSSCSGSSEVCGLGASCWESMYCLRLCDDDSDCRESEGYICDSILMSTITYCIPG
jgi:hypothetical protein